MRVVIKNIIGAQGRYFCSYYLKMCYIAWFAWLALLFVHLKNYIRGKTRNQKTKMHPFKRKALCSGNGAFQTAASVSRHFGTLVLVGATIAFVTTLSVADGSRPG